ncbi:hypothetical protein MHU86_603 [Fragilaria crotonensis]|nr:hypothetical protein MHU86_603 [Fragilaria crotonensis]
MSAYAMPGAFPPISGFTSTYNSGFESSSEFSEQQSLKHPQHYESHTPRLQFKPVSFSSICSSPIAPDSPLSPASKNPVTEEKKAVDMTSQKEVGILVKEAKIDMARLIKSLTTSAKNRKRDVIPPPPPVILQDENSNKVTAADEHEDDPHKEAIQFELSISFNGRTYSATRTLPNIVQLRNDLIAEINSRRQALRQRRLRWIPQRNTTHKAAEGGVEWDNDDETVKTIDEDDTYDVTIPELPDYYSSEDRNTGGSFAGRGFTLLQALLRSYCPAMEGWLRKVTDLVPPMDSPSLSHFLWEPVSGEVKMPTQVKLPTRGSSHSFCTLVSIKEDEEVDDEEELYEALGVSVGKA